MVDPTDVDSEARLRESIELFYFAYRAFTDRADKVLQRRGLGRVHHRILYFVGRQPNGAVNGLLQALGVSKQALNAPLRQLVAMKLIAVETAPHDRRVRQLALTPAGRTLERQLTGLQMKHLGAVFAATGPQCEAQWRAVMVALGQQARLPG
jgi:DNA-binding MarR family transcriptional regulator